MKLRALRIDATTGVISEVIINDYMDISAEIGCRMFTSVRLSKNEVLYVDDEGLINGTKQGFLIATNDGLLAGNGIVLGITDWGDGASTQLSANDLMTKFGIVAAVDFSSGVKTPTRTAASLN